MSLLAIDPGIKGLGWAWFENRALAACGVVPMMARAPYQPLDLGTACEHAWHHVSLGMGGRKADHTAIERMCHYPDSAHSDAKANDLLDLQAIGAFVLGNARAYGAPCSYYTPQQWKGSVPKNVMAGRIVAALTLPERKIVGMVRGSKAHNAIDAIGIGLAHLGRLGE